MVIATETVNIDVTLPDATELPDGRSYIRFELTDQDVDVTDNQTIPKGPIDILLDADGIAVATLWPNDRGQAATAYRVSVVVKDELGRDVRDLIYRFGFATFDDGGGPYDLSARLFSDLDPSAVGTITLKSRLRLVDGTTADPALAFAADTDTGLSRPAANTMDLSTAGVRRARLSNGALDLSVPVTGTAVQADSGDDTAGRLLTSGAGGILGPAPRQADKGWTDFDDMTIGGLWSLGVDNLANGPLGEAVQAYNGVCQVWRRDFSTGQSITQIVNQDGDLYLRSGTLAGIGSATWEKILDTSDIESGSNANGTYSRLDDGSLICVSPDFDSQDITTATGSIYRTASSVTWNLPIAMAATAEWGGYVVAMGNSQTHWGSLRVTGASACEITAFGPTSIAGRTVRAVAIGR